MKSIAISGSPRENVGKRDAKELRYEGKVPAVLYGGPTQTHFAVSAADLKPVVTLRMFISSTSRLLVLNHKLLFRISSSIR